MMSDFDSDVVVKVELLLFFGRLRRQYDNQHTGTDVVMARDMHKGGGRRTTVFVLVLLLLSSLPMIPSTSADSGDPNDYQAQDITATYDVLNETTTITWRNIDQVAGDNQLFRDLWDVTYHLFRHNAPITPANINEATEWASVVACDKEVYTQYVECAGLSGNPHHEGHSAVYEVGAGTNASYYYAITSEFEGNFTTPLEFNASSLYEPVLEITTPIRSPYNVEATFDPTSATTEVRWINYNDLNIPGMTLLPEDGLNGLKINIWRTTQQVTRDTDLLNTYTPVATLASSKTSHSFDIEQGLNREVFYSVTYLLPNWTDEGNDYQDTRFLSNNALDSAVLEDTSPPNPATGIGVVFIEDELGGKGNTTVSWNPVMSEVGESYRIYRSGVSFNNTTDFGVELIATITNENTNSFTYQVPIGNLGYSFYCVVVEDQFGAFSEEIAPTSCDVVYEDAFNNWVAEPTNVQATFLGNGVTRVTWNDQIGAEGEIYHIWRSQYRTQGIDFVENESLEWQGSVTDGIGTFDVHLPDGIKTDGIHYFVTSEARYGHLVGTHHYTGLQHNWAGPVYEDTESPQTPSLDTVIMVGELQTVTLIWQNYNVGQEEDETYSVYRHLGDPFGGSEFGSSSIDEDGWALVNDSIPEGSSTTIVKEIPVEPDTQREVWYAVIITDQYGNQNPTIFPGANALLVKEDTAAPTIDFEIWDDTSTLVSSTSLIKGDYTLRVTSNEQLLEEPLISVVTSAGGDLSSGIQPMNDLPNNAYYFPIAITSSANAGSLFINISLSDMSENDAAYNITNYSIDAKAPTVTIFSPASSNDGAKYLYGESIKLTAGAEDDVGIASMQVRFVQNYGTANTVSEPWRNVTGLTISENGEWSIDMDFSSGNYLYGTHQVSVKAMDTAGNVRTASVLFVTDWCRHRVDGETICEAVNPVSEDPDVVYPELNMTDPPYMIAWVTAGISVLAIIVSLMVISTSMSGPKKKKGDDEDEDEDWMSEFIGTSAEPDMEAITGGKPKEQKAMEDDDDDEDPFAVNTTQPKRRRKKKDDEEDEEESSKKSSRRSPKRRAPKRKKD
tara:strand:+ start:1459 stop:4659 length:3201 start_codon:yes stop_codon:yes gene_type:complete